MSIIEYFTAKADREDPLYPLFNEVSALRKQIVEARQRILMECVSISDIGRGNDAKVVIADRSLFEGLNAELTQKEARLTKIIGTFTKLDEVIKPALDADYLARVAPTPRGVMSARNSFDRQRFNVSSYAKDAAIEAVSKGIALTDVKDTYGDDVKDLIEKIKMLDEITVRCSAILKEL